MKKLTYLLIVLGLAVFSIGAAKSAFAQSWGGIYGSGNIAPQVTASASSTCCPLARLSS
jgi:hypothetical protein